ncbi:OLC1v1032490C1 [Oldenlandia corymbosa var. corymbosa]|uniref:OLC1v1032490C1 n=1 Tax=Oldenlandia corymbosa var. corymbosa TaxID=529605 RepID=A0AAV1CKW4_OLDCO|nr:OLC1v1032490C1 [Oldenlandia corymbosa var. corymbosa]
MEDVITEAPPPSRFLLEDLNIFTRPAPPLPSPFLVFSRAKSSENLHPSLLVIALSSPSVYVLHHLPSKFQIGTLILPEIPFSGNSTEPSLKDKSCNIYTLKNADESILIVSVQYPVTPERSHDVAKLLVGGQIIPERVLILDSIQSSHFRGKLSRDDDLAFKLETSYERINSDDSHLVTGLDYFPSGSMVDGLSAALLAQCQLRKIKGTLCLSWPEFGISSKLLVKSILQKALPGLDLTSIPIEDDSSRDKVFDSELYT